jgi:uncharacterized protein YqhQ
MLRQKNILRATSLFFLLLVLNASFFAVFNPKTTNHSTQTEQADSAPNQEDSQKDTATYSETVPFDAVIHVGLQCEFHKIVFVAVPQFVVSYFDILNEPIKQTFQSVFLLSYFQNLFKTSILINAP